MAGCCYSCLKFLVMIFNLIYMLLGLALLGTVLWIYLGETIVAPVAKDISGYNWLFFLLMAIGAIMTIMGFLGCCGAFQESQCMLATFFALVLVLIAGQVVALTWMYRDADRIEDFFVRSIKLSFQEHYNYDEVKTKVIDVVQKELQCCGAAGSGDWSNARFNKINKDSNNIVDLGISSLSKLIGAYSIPASCCHRNLDHATCEAVRKVKAIGSLLDNIYKEGCVEKGIKLMKAFDWLFLIFLLILAFVEVLAMIFSIVLCCTARRIDQYKA